jgi:ABC-type uncharacterized transport system permease subunit
VWELLHAPLLLCGTESIMAKDYVGEIGYYFWFVPSVISVFFSGILLFIRISDLKKMKMVGFTQTIFALADILQCTPWFFGSIYSTTTNRSHSNLCHVQEAMFKVGVLTKCLLASIATAALSYYAVTKQPLRISKVLPPSIVLVIYTVITLVINLILHGNEVACENLHNFNIEHPKNFQIVYCVCFLLPIFLFCFINFLASTWAIYSSRTSDPTIVSAIMTPHHDRIAAFSIIAWLAYIPALLFFLFFLFNEINIPLYCITGLMVSSTGILGSGYLILSPLIDKTRRVNLFIFIERLLDENEDTESVDGVKLSEISVATSTV